MTRRSAMLFFLTVATGCSSSEAPPYPVTTVTGVVTLDGKPLPNAEVKFAPDGTTVGFGGKAYTDAEGQYKLRGTRGENGVPPGDYRVFVSKRKMPDGSDVPPNDPTPPIESPARETLPPRYSDGERGVLKAKVPENGGTIDFALDQFRR
jgi:hypothetical protein